MKKSLVWVVLAGIILTMNSCGGDDPEPDLPIVGTWARSEYEFTEVQTGFTNYWEGYDPETLGESGYTILFKSDGTYTRAFVAGDDSIYDSGDWTLDGSSLKLSPKGTGVIDKIEELGIVGTEFSVIGDITEERMQISQVVAFSLPSDAQIDAADGDLSAIPRAEWHVIDVTLVYKFNKLK